MTLIEILVVALATTVIGTLLGAIVGAFTGDVLHASGRGALFGFNAGWVLSFLLIIVVVNWNRFKKWRAARAQGQTPPN